MASEDDGMRWWGVVGLHLLGDDAKASIPVLEAAMTDSTHEIRIMADWVLVRLGEKEKAMADLNSLLFGQCHVKPFLHNVVAWMGEDGHPLVRAMKESKQGQGRGFPNSIIGHEAKKIGMLQN